MPDYPPKTPEAPKRLKRKISPRPTTRSRSSRAGPRPGWTSGLFRADPERSRQGLLHRHSAAECDRLDPHRAHARAHPDRHAHALAPHARLPHALAAGHGPCGNRHAGGRRARTGQGRPEARRDRPRGVRAARLGVEGALRRQHQAADDPPGRLVRLVARTIHAGSAAVPRGARSFPAPLPRGADLSRPLHRQLVPALHDGAERPRSGAQGARRPPLAHPLSGGRLDRNRSSSPPRGPETMLGDTAVAVHPEDERYQASDRAGRFCCR